MNLPAQDPADRPDRSTDPAGRVKRRVLDEVFGDVLPTVTSDEIDDRDGRSVDDDRERWYRDNRPPHHG